MSTHKKKAKPAKKPAARQIPPPPPGWEIVDKDDPRLKKLPCRPMAFDPEFPRSGWSKSGYDVGDCIACSFCKTLHYALPIAQATPPAADPTTTMIRLRLPSEKPTKEDGDFDGDIMIFFGDGIAARPWNMNMGRTVIAWLPGRLPEGLLPKPPTQEELWRKEFDIWVNSCPYDLGKGAVKDMAWKGFLAAKKGGQS